ncbi:MAG: cyclic pyranopterin monophosphate synthase MoaC [Actinomycetota bacterium]
MVDVESKDETLREATAVCTLTGDPDVIKRVVSGETKKGDAVAAAKIAGTLAAKKTPELIPLCHPVRTTFAGVSISSNEQGSIQIRATVRGRDRTGFEMEALVACSTAALTIYDMAKAEDPRMRIDGLRIVAKSGGKSGSVTFE